MSEAQHTPGPWDHDQPENMIMAWREDGTQMLVAQARSVSVTKEVRDANARLIAAAPELLDAMGEMLRVMSHATPDDLPARLGECYKKCVAVHRKATGAA